ncbi:hypothetical protein Tco_0893578 [Tanacetum coccineum]|uniref:Uncharacterized protein n=1 Tax=Tanacetum coccineum TaxID=301880 RepID=A0ABQ5CCI8_9ASTR
MDKPITHEIIVLVKDILMPLAEKIRANASEFKKLLKEEMFDDLHSMTDIDEYSEMACKYLEKVKEYECLEIEPSKQKDSVGKEDYHKLVKSFCTLEQHSIYLELALQQYLKAQLQDMDIAISELKKLIEKSKGKSVETKFDKLPVRKTNAIKVLKPSILGKPTPFSDSIEKGNFSKPRSVTKTDVHKWLSKPVTPHNLPQTQIGKQAEISKNVIQTGMYRIDTRPTQTRTTQLAQTFRNSKNQVSTSTGVMHNTSVSRP